MSKYTNITVDDAPDGSGDAVLTFPQDFIDEQDWREGDEITIKVENQTLVMINRSKETRDRIKEK